MIVRTICNPLHPIPLPDGEKGRERGNLFYGRGVIIFY
jgi:hypothetical protein